MMQFHGKQAKSLTRVMTMLCVSLLMVLQAFGDGKADEGKDTLENVNRTFGFALFSENGWDEDADSLMRRLKMPYEATEVQGKRVLSSYSVLVCAGCQVYQTKARANEKGIEEIELVFANKGDSVGDGEKKKQQVRKFQKKLQEDSQTLRKRLSEAFGKPKVKGEDTEWNTKEALIVLTFSRKEFLKLTVSQLQTAGKQSVTAERRKVRMAIKDKKYSDNVSKNDFGDVFIENIPMVNQGGKGYCGPATVERCLLYYGIEGYDMHELAEIFDTKQGGGTRMSQIIGDTGKILKKYSVELSREKSRLKGIRQAIDNGYPIFRLLHTEDDVESRMNLVTRDRQGKTVTEWKKVLSKLPTAKKAKKSNHFNLVVGYNEKTEEIGISDSWGNFAQLRWMPWKDFENTTFDLYVVKPR